MSYLNQNTNLKMTQNTAVSETKIIMNNNKKNFEEQYESLKVLSHRLLKGGKNIVFIFN